MNFIGSKALRKSACIAEPDVARHFKSVLQLSLPAYENMIGVFLGSPSSGKMLRKNMCGIPGLSQKI